MMLWLATPVPPFEALALLQVITSCEKTGLASYARWAAPV